MELNRDIGRNRNEKWKVRKRRRGDGKERKGKIEKGVTRKETYKHK